MLAKKRRIKNEGDEHSRRDVALVVFALAVLTAVVFCRVLFAGFITLDDPTYVMQNPHVTGGLTIANIRWALTATHGANWHPLTWLSHMIDYSIYGPRAGGHHATSLLFHLANVVLLFLMLRQMTRCTWKSAFVAALFAVHPLHVESVAWVAERKDVLSTFFWMMTLWAYFWYTESQMPSRIVAYVAVVVLLALGLMAKPMLVVLPFTLLLLDYWPLGRYSKSKRESKKTGEPVRASVMPLIVEKLPLFLMSAASSVVTFVVQKKAGAVGPLEEMPLQIRLANACVSYVAYIGKMLWPVRLVPFYPHPGYDIRIGYVVASLLFLLAVTFVTIRLRRRFPYLLVGWLWYVGVLVPVIGIVQVGSQAMADRYTYVSLIGLFIIFVWGMSELVKRWASEARGGSRKRIHLAWITGIIIVFALAARAFVQVGYWKDSFVLFSRTLQVSPRNHVAHYNLGVALIDTKRLDEAYAQFAQTLQIEPGYADAYYNQGFIQQARGRLDMAIDKYRRAVEINPRLVQAHNNLAICLFAKGDYRSAWQEVSRCRALGFEPHPGFIKALRQKMIEQGIQMPDLD